MNTQQPLDPHGLGRVHFIGMGGAGMSAVARLLLARGVAVSGSDAKDSAGLRRDSQYACSSGVKHRLRNPGRSSARRILSISIR